MAVSSSGCPEIEELVSNLKKSTRAEQNANLQHVTKYKDLAESFKMFDINKDGKTLQGELGTVLCSLGETLSEAKLDQMIIDVDADGFGKFDLQEFITLKCHPERATASSKLPGDQDHKADNNAAALHSAFDVFDTNKDGFISARELHRVIFGLGDKQVSMEDYRYMIRCVNTDGYQLVDFKEFQTLMPTGPAAGSTHSTVHITPGTAH